MSLTWPRTTMLGIEPLRKIRRKFPPQRKSPSCDVMIEVLRILLLYTDFDFNYLLMPTEVGLSKNLDETHQFGLLHGYL